MEAERSDSSSLMSPPPPSPPPDASSVLYLPARHFGPRSLASLPNIAESLAPISDSNREEFQKFIIVTPTPQLVSAVFQSARLQLFRQFVAQATKIQDRLKHDLNSSVMKRSEEMVQYESVRTQIQSYRRTDFHSQRPNAFLNLSFHSKSLKLQKLRTQMFQNNLEKTVLFIEFLHSLEESHTVMPAVDLDAFLKSFEQPSAKMNRLQAEIPRLQSVIRPLFESSPAQGS